MPTCLIAAGPIRNQPGPFRDLLLRAGFTPIDVPGHESITPDQLRAALPGAESILAGGEPLPADLIALAPRLRAIARTGVGYDAVDVAEATRRGIAVAITPGTNHDSVAEQAFGLLLALTRQVARLDRLIRAGQWPRTLVRPLRGQTLGLLGLGRIGRAMVPRAQAFGMAVIACDTLADAAFDARHAVRRVSFDELLAESDVLSLHLPLTPQTRGLFHRDVFARMKPGSILLNTSRGGLVVESDLHAALTLGPLAAAGLDVTDPEPPDPSHPLLQLDNVVTSPHVGGIDTKAMSDMAEKAAWCVVELHQGRWPADCIVNPEIGPDWRW